jgi:NitT/TauT family transport system permease protein
MELPFGYNGLIWNSMVSWAGGWFFLMAAESFNVGNRDFRLPGLGSYLQAAANAGDTTAILLGLGTLVLVIILLDQLVWRPLLVWADRFKVEMSAGDTPPTSWFYDILNRSWLMQQFTARSSAASGSVSAWCISSIGARPRSLAPADGGRSSPAGRCDRRRVDRLCGAASGSMLITLPLSEWGLMLQA